jgi:sporulation protein YlmC with PRC-barrel domain
MPYFQSGESRSTNNRNAADDNSRNQLGEVQRASKVIGLNVRNLQSEKVGRVQDLIVDLQAGRLVEVIVASGGFMRLGGELSAIPPQSFSYGIHSDVLTLDRSRTDLASAPHFKSGDWNQATNRDQVQTVYQSYHVPAYFDTNRVDNTAQNSQDRDGNSLTPLQQGNSPADVDTTRQIRRQIVADTSLSVNAHNVKIITIDGKVTLRGPVNSEEEKREIGEIAAKVATASNVTNQLQVRNASTTSSIN